MTDHCLAEDIARLLLGPGWEQRSHVELLAALDIAFRAVWLARETGVRPTATIVTLRRGSHDDAA